MVVHRSLEVQTRGRDSTEITALVEEAVKSSGIRAGLCNVFLQHTSASLMLCENADPEVRADLERFMSRLAPDGDPLFRHRAEGDDDMPAHVRSVLTHSSLTIPVRDGRMLLGTWQGIYLWEHRTAPHRRRITITLYGD
jgi:secondary thiamine-phosphate synthase enzyme